MVPLSPHLWGDVRRTGGYAPIAEGCHGVTGGYAPIAEGCHGVTGGYSGFRSIIPHHPAHRDRPPHKLSIPPSALPYPPTSGEVRAVEHRVWVVPLSPHLWGDVRRTGGYAPIAEGCHGVTGGYFWYSEHTPPPLSWSPSPQVGRFEHRFYGVQFTVPSDVNPPLLFFIDIQGYHSSTCRYTD